jgi:hypothetical protein
VLECHIITESVTSSYNTLVEKYLHGSKSMQEFVDRSKCIVGIGDQGVSL